MDALVNTIDFFLKIQVPTISNIAVLLFSDATFNDGTYICSAVHIKYGLKHAQHS